MSMSVDSEYKEIQRCFNYSDPTTNQYYQQNGRIYNDGSISCSSNLPSGAIVNISLVALNFSGFGNFFTSHYTDIQTIANNIISKCADWEGQFYYSNSTTARLFPEQTGFTDCSGLVWALYNQIAGIKLSPATATEYANECALVTTARAGEDLDTSLLKKGDLICWHNNYDDQSQDPDDFFHVVIYDGNGGYWEATSSFNTPTSRCSNL